jgi:UDP-N-acetylglucosamine acyltransferase
MSIHPSAVIDPSAELGHDVTVHPFTVIEGNVQIGDGCEIGPHAVIRRFTRLGARNCVTVGAVLGDLPQDLKYKGEETCLVIGDENLIREYATIHRATGEGNSTTIGSRNLLMAYSHIGHNCVLGDEIMMANCVQLAGHTVVEDFAVFGGLAATHQFARVGTMAMVGAMSGVRLDVPPYVLADGLPARPTRVNSVALRRRGVPPEAVAAIREAFRLLYRSDLNTSDAIARIRAEVAQTPEIVHLVEFIEKIAEGERGRALN